MFAAVAGLLVAAEGECGVEFVTARPRDVTANELLITVDLASRLNMVEDAEAAQAKVKQIW